MKVVIVGSGLIGVTTAYALHRRGFDVTVIDRQLGAGRETSHANGALLTPSMSDPWNAPGCWRVLLASLARSDAPLQLRVKALPSLVGWGMEFLKNSLSATFERNTLLNRKLAMYSLQEMQRLREETRIDYGRGALGSLRVFRDETSLTSAASAAARWATQGLRYRKLSPHEILEVEPALQPIIQELAGGIHYLDDETGDAARFCEGLARHLQTLGVQFRFGATVQGLEERDGKVRGVLTDQGRVVADCYVVAGGSHSTTLLRSIGIQLPVRPAKGYSITFDMAHGAASLRVPVVDDALHAVLVPLPGMLRAAGTAEFAGFDLSLPPVRIRNLLNFMQQILPRVPFKESSGKPWCGLRAMSVDGVPIIGATPISNLFVNTGHGHLGWTMAAGSASVLGSVVSAAAPGIDPVPYQLARFGARS